jgi:hypothetical protein
VNHQLKLTLEGFNAESITVMIKMRSSPEISLDVDSLLPQLLSAEDFQYLKSSSTQSPKINSPR